jgi:hypothetical protein
MKGDGSAHLEEVFAVEVEVGSWKLNEFQFQTIYSSRYFMPVAHSLPPSNSVSLSPAFSFSVKYFMGLILKPILVNGLRLGWTIYIWLLIVTHLPILPAGKWELCESVY